MSGQCVVGCCACPAVDWWQSVWMNVDTLYVAVLQLCFAGKV